ncbi:MAG: type II toxin-antitoxin system HicB family antitoxin [Syntrophomonas sp.]
MDKYWFPAVFESCSEGGYSVTFPDLPGIVTEGDTIEDALVMAKDALELHLYGMEKDQEEIPCPSFPSKIQPSDGAFVSIIEAWMPLVREQMLSKAVKKTLTIPQWLNEIAEEKKVNYSQILQLALKEHLDVKEPSYLKK